MEPIVSIAIPQRGTDYVRHLTPQVEGARWTEGFRGCETAEFTVTDPVTSAALTQDCQVTISDPRDGAVVWTGSVARNGVHRSPLGHTATVRCVGNVDDLYNTRHWSLPYIVRDYSEWERETIKHRTGRNWDTDVGARPMDPPWDSVLLSIDQGKGIYPGTGGRMQYVGHMGSDMYIGSVRFIADHGTAQHPKVDLGAPSFLVSRLEVGDNFWGVIPWSLPWQTTAQTVRRSAGTYGWPVPPNPLTNPPGPVTDSNYLVLSTEFTAAVGYTVTNEHVWAAFSYIVVCGQRVDRYGQNIVGMSDEEMDGTLRAGDIWEDMLGRCLGGVIDPTLAEVRMDTWRLTQADYRDPTTPGEVGDDLLLVHPDHLWRVGRRDSTTGLAAFTWRLWDDTPRYVVDAARAEVDLDGSPDPLYNSVTVKWVDWKGRPRSASFRADPANYPDIADLRGIREAPPIDLDASLGEWATVERVGTQMLDQVARRIPAGTITVTGPVLDTVTQELVPPSQIEAGHTLSLSSDEPVVAHRIQEVTHEGCDAAEISVGQPRLSLDQIVATRGRRRR